MPQNFCGIFIFRKGEDILKTSSKAWLAALIGYGIFGFSFIFSKTALEYAGTFTLLAARFFIALLALNLLLLFGKAKISFAGKPIGKLFLLGFIQPVCYFIFETYGIASTSAAFSGVIIGTVPIVGLILGVLFLHEKCSFLQGICTVFSVFGVYLTTSGGFSVSAKGFFLLLGAVVSAALFTVLSRKTSEHFTAFERTYAMFVLGFFIFLPLALFEHEGQLLLMLKPFSEPQFIISELYLGVVSSVIAFLLINFALNHIPAGKALIFSNFTTVVSVLAGIFIMGDSFTSTQLIGIAIIVFSVFIVSGSKK
ncbi:MAG: DMT family transporter [Oscillospiraceae bacterium]|nr:DMT family transporter [Oscillospiraceae bacterium]